MEQNFYGQVDQVAANNIYNIYIRIKGNDLNLSNLTSQDLFDVVYYVRAENREIIRRKYLNIPTASILLITLFLLFIILLKVNAILKHGILSATFSNNILYVIATICLFLFPILFVLLYSRTKYLNPILVENNKIIYELELEIQRRELRGQN